MKTQFRSPGEHENHANQPRVDRDEGVQIQDGNLLASLNLQEIQYVNINRQAFHRVYMSSDPSTNHASTSHQGTSE
jgi:hypothetical protein